MDIPTETRPQSRKYKRRSDQERIAELERRIAEVKAKQVAKEKKDDPVLREIPKLQRQLRKFAQLSADHNRPDISNSILAFTAGLERILRSESVHHGSATPQLPDESPS
jgi:hypothetical protein